MVFRKKTKLQDQPRRRLSNDQSAGRSSPYSYYARPTSNDQVTDTNRARREPIPRSKSEIARYLGERFGLIIAVIAGLALLITSVQVSPQPRLSIINDTVVYRLHPDSTYIDNVTSSLRSSWTNSNKLTINTADVAKRLQTAYPEVADASVALPVLGQRPVVYLQLTRPSLLLMSEGGAASVLDERGRVLAPASQVNNLDSLNLPTVVDQSGIPVKSGELVLSSSSVKFIEDALYQLKAADITYNRVVLPPASQELDVYLTGKPYYLKLNIHSADTAREQVGAFLATTAHLNKLGQTPASYIDARLPGRVYYK